LFPELRKTNSLTSAVLGKIKKALLFKGLNLIDSPVLKKAPRGKENRH